MHDVGDVMLFDDLRDGSLISQVDLFEEVFGILRDGVEVGEIACVGQAVEVDQSTDIGLIDDVVQQVRADESGSSCNK